MTRRKAIAPAEPAPAEPAPAEPAPAEPDAQAEPATPEIVVPAEVALDHPDLRALLRAVRKRDRQAAVARLLVEEFARAEGLEADVAWHRFRRDLEIDRVSALRKGDLRKADVDGLRQVIEARVGAR